MSLKTVIFILGMSRTGSSLLSRILGFAGAAYPGSLVPGSPGNELGYWEPVDVLKINEAFLAQIDSSLYDPASPSPEEPRTWDALAVLKTRTEQFFQQQSDPLLVIKEPRIAIVPGIWIAGAKRAGYSPVVVIPVRHPEEVIASLVKRDGISRELAATLWLKSNLAAEAASRAIPRVFVEYSRLMIGWRDEVDRIGRMLSISLAVGDDFEVERFIRADMRHHVEESAAVEFFGDRWINDTYGLLSKAAQGMPVDTGTLDQIRSNFVRCERSFRIASEEHRARVADLRFFSSNDPLSLGTSENPHEAR